MSDPIFRMRRDRARWVTPGVLLAHPDRPGTFVAVTAVATDDDRVTVTYRDGAYENAVTLDALDWATLLVPDEPDTAVRYGVDL